MFPRLRLTKNGKIDQWIFIQLTFSVVKFKIMLMKTETLFGIFLSVSGRSQVGFLCPYAIASSMISPMFSVFNQCRSIFYRWSGKNYQGRESSTRGSKKSSQSSSKDSSSRIIKGQPQSTSLHCFVPSCTYWYHCARYTNFLTRHTNMHSRQTERSVQRTEA